MFAAIVRRDLRLQLSYPAQIVTSMWAVVTSVFTFFFIGELVGANPILGDIQGGYFAFAVIGVTVLALSSAVIGVFVGTIQRERGGGTLEILLAGTTPLWVLMAASLLVPMIFAVVQAIGYVIFGWILAPEALNPLAWIRALPVLVLILGSFGAIGLWSAAFVIAAQRGDPFASFFAQASNLVAGAVFPVALLPGWLQALAHLIPAFYGFNALRALMLSNAPYSSVADEILILLAFDIVLALIGWYLIKRALRFAKVMGTLGVS
jgi:ABC-2 type transport system permease protein